MDKSLIKDGFVWGIALWFVGYVLGIVFFMMVPHAIIGWCIMPIGIVITLFVLVKKIKKRTLAQYAVLGFLWTVIAIVADYLLLVRVFKPADGYYKLDVYVYYTVTFFLPIIYGLKRKYTLGVKQVE